MAEPLLRVDLTSTRLKNEIRRAGGNLRSGGPVTQLSREVNEGALQALKEKAAGNLAASMAANGSNPRGRSGALLAAILDDRSHSFSSTGFSYFIIDRVYRSRKVRYWRAIEVGSTASVGRRIPLAFLSDKGNFTSPSSARATRSPQRTPKTPVRDSRIRPGVRQGVTQRRGADETRPVGPRELGRGDRFVTVRRPIRAYHYNQRAIAAFQAEKTYAKHVRRVQARVRRLGLPLQVG